jgi:hypothetical protein
LIRKFAANNIDIFNNLRNDKSFPVKCLTTYSDYTTYENEIRRHFDVYFQSDDCNIFINLVSADLVIAGTEQLSFILPIIELDTQRDKVNLSKDIEDMLRKELERNNMITPVEVINILFGINSGEGKNPYYS